VLHRLPALLRLVGRGKALCSIQLKPPQRLSVAVAYRPQSSRLTAGVFDTPKSD
jgi:hypothetical protein